MIYVLISYLLGSIPFGLLLVKIFEGKDIREIGSKNIGATNVMRTGNKFLAFCTFLLDALKGTLAAYLSLKNINDSLMFQISIISIFLGHMFPIWLKFKGGKGISTLFGVTAYLAPVIFLISIITWYLMFKITKISAAGGITATIATFILTFFIHIPNLQFCLSIAYGIIMLLIVFKHKENIIRIIDGNEKSFK